MNYHNSSPDPPRTLSERMERLSDNLQALGDRLKASVATVLGDTIADAVRDSVRGLLGGKESPPTPRREYREYRDDYRDGADDPWGDQDRRWQDEEEFRPAREGIRRETSPNSRRWRDALDAAVRTCLWFLGQRPRRRPVLTTLAVTLVAGATGFVAGPALAAGAGVLASVAGLLLTADAYQSAAELAAG